MQELSAIQADRRAYPADDCDRLLLTAAQTLDEGLTDVSQFPSILKLLDELRRCDTVYFPWDFDHEHGRTVDPWTLFYTAERYFHQHDSPLDERLRVMAHLAYSVYQLPRSDPEAPDASGTFGRHDPWPMDILLLLEHYAHMAEADVSPTTDTLWIRLVLAVHQQFRKRCEVAPLQPLTMSDAVRETTECFSAFRRALSRKAVDTDGVQLLQLYRTCAERARAIQGLGETVHSYELLSDVSFIHYVKLGQIIAREAMALPSSSETLENVELVLAQLGWDTVFFELAGDSRLLARAVRSRPFIVGDLDGW